VTKKAENLLKSVQQVMTTRVSGACFIYSDVGPVICPLCGVRVPAKTPHRCGRKE
jgi:hypothetical protein